MTIVNSRLLNGRRNRPKTGQNSTATEGDNTDSGSTASLRLQMACIAATLVAAVIFTLTEHDDHRHTWWCTFEILMQTALVFTGTAYFRIRRRLLLDTSVLLPSLVMVVALSLLCEPIQRLFFDHGHAFEVLIMHSQSNLMLALAVCGFKMKFQRLAMLIAVFLTIFSCTISNARGLLPLTILFAACSLTWLVCCWWETVDRRLTNNDTNRLSPLWLASGLLIPIAVMIAVAGFGTNSVTAALEGFMPSSGGTGDFDPFSRGGVNNGDALVAGNQNIKSFAPLEDAPFLDSDKPSLYDMFNDQFDEPPKKIENQQRAIALPPEVLQHIHQQMAEARQAGREFSLVRENSSTDKSRIHDLESHAAFYVAGRVPAHFRLEVYEHFDGVTWFPLDDAKPDTIRWPRIESVEDRPWLSLDIPGRGLDIYGGPNTHSLKIANLSGNTIPAPPHLVGVSIDHVDREDMYNVAPTGLVSLQRETVPELTPISLVSECIDRNALQENSLVVSEGQQLKVTTALPDTSSTQKIRDLALQWTKGLPHGWAQITAIESQLKRHCVLDRDAKVPEDCEAPVSEFLFETRRGPEYLFASSAACLLRSLGYSARMVSGFYARPENYDATKQHTAVLPRDAHFWCEVFIAAHTWVTIESSPDYEVLGPAPNLLTRIWQQCSAAWSVIAANATILATLTLLMVAAVALRHRLRERLQTLYWRWRPNPSIRIHTLRLVALIDFRLHVVGLPRKSSATLRRWAQHPQLQQTAPAMTRLSALADRARFAPNDSKRDRTSLDSTLIELQQLESQLSLKMLTNHNTPQPSTAIPAHA